MRVACVVGSAGILTAVLSPKPFHPIGLALAVVVTVVIFSMTFLPVWVRWLSYSYPWALVLLGIALVYLMGPRQDAILLIAGGFFIGSLVVKLPGLIVLSVTTTVLMLATALSHDGPMGPELTETWTSVGSAMAAVVAPAAVAGRLLVSALARALQERQALVEKISDEQQALEETVRMLETTRTQLTHAQKLELVSQMAGGIAHDMNNALTAVIGEASMLEEDVAEERDRILEAAAHAAKLTHQLMVFGRRDTSQPRPVDLVATLHDCHRSIRRLVPSDVIIEPAIPEERVVVVLDPTQLLQVVLNLAGNASDAMPGGGTLRLELKTDPANQEAILTIADTGAGIPPDVLPKIFDPFFTTKPAGRGTGLGLANVRRLVEEMEGSVDVASQVGQGTTFTIRLPTSEVEVAAESRVVGASVARSATILVVDDDVRVRAVVYSSLERHGYRVLEASTIQSAIDIVQDGEKVDLVLTDVVMPAGGGAEVIRRVLTVSPSTRVLVMSGYADDETVRRGIAQGEYPFIAKPFTSGELAEAVDRALSD